MNINFQHAFVDNSEDRDWLTNTLKNEVITVSFIKKDGTERNMQCTLNENKIPKESHPKGVSRSKSTDSISVFDLEKKEWRSFRWDSVRFVKIENQY